MARRAYRSFLAIPVFALALAATGCESDGTDDTIDPVNVPSGTAGGGMAGALPGGAVTADAGTPSGASIPGGGGTPSGGTPSGGTPSGGTPSGGTPSGGTLSGGTPSGGTPSGGTPSGGMPSGGMPSGLEGGTPDAGPDGGMPDAGRDSGMPGDGGPVVGPTSDGGCPCTTPPPQRLSAAMGPLGRGATTRLSAGTAYYPTMGNGPFPAVAIVPGFLNSGPEMASWGPFYASWGIICVVTNSGSTDFPDARGQYLLNAIRDLKAANTTQGSPLFGKLSGQYGTSGYSMGGGGTTIASSTDKTLRSSVGLAPWSPVGRGITVPTLHICGTSDSTASCGSNARPAYDAIPAATPKMLLVVNGGGHLTSWFGPGDTPGGISGGWALAFNKVFLEGDERWRPLLLSTPSGGTVTTNIK
jgi:hypothetical protein